MAFHIGDMLRAGSTNFTATETNLTSLHINGTERGGYWLTASWTGVTGGTNQVGTFHSTTPPTGGTWTATVGGQTTATIQWNDSTATILSRLAALKNVVLNNVYYPGPLGAQCFLSTTSVATGIAAGDVPITFQGPLANQPITMTINAGSLTGNTATSVVNTTTGVGPTCAITLQDGDDNSTWRSPAEWGTLWLPPGLNQPTKPLLFETPRAYISSTLTFGGTGVFTKLQVAVVNDIEGFG